MTSVDESPGACIFMAQKAINGKCFGVNTFNFIIMCSNFNYSYIVCSIYVYQVN